ncbi:SAUR-like auxin-responsive protein family [Zostera marina]|uniref:SAUR-like auxin-responsive protein family n=1 Tax=Zostera marina TaxID=29655 RepID=A0A0K9PJC1_ZOSMR|nr:SAUR-like auxin-responsive protein family [Zostera marina]
MEANNLLNTTTRLRQMLQKWRKRSHKLHISEESEDVHLSLVKKDIDEPCKLPSTSKLWSIRQIVQLRQMLKRWRAIAREHSSSSSSLPSDVPSGHLAVCVGLEYESNTTRYVVPTSYLNHPMFLKLLTRREEVCGFTSIQGPLHIPCRFSFFQEIITHIQANTQPSPSSFIISEIL